MKIYTDGSGANPVGGGSAFAWMMDGRGSPKIVHKDGLTNNEAEYSAVLDASSHAPRGSQVEILSDSQLVIYQLRGSYQVREPALGQLFQQVKAQIAERRLRVRFTWIPRAQNKIGKELDKAKRQHTGPEVT